MRILGLFISFIFLLTTPVTLFAEEVAWQPYLTIVGKSWYGDHFTHYKYVNPNAPKGGELDMVAVGTFDSLNPYIVAGVPPEGLVPLRGGLLYNTLMDMSPDQGGVGYPSVASMAKVAPDYSWVTFKLEPKAKWHDGKPITVEDVIWSFKILSQYSPYYRAYYVNVDHVKQTAPQEVTFYCKDKGVREMAVILCDLVVLPKHWWTGKDAQGHQRDITKPTLEIPLGCGPYKIASVVPGKSIVWERVKDYWGKDFPQNVGRNNYGIIKYNYLRDENASWEAFKKGNVSDYRQEKSIQRWMQQYTFPAFTSGHVKKIGYPHPAQGWSAYYFNTRKPKFADIRVRKALFLALDFDSMNRAIYFGKYRRFDSYYGHLNLSARGLPDAEELKYLNLVKDQVPAELFTKPMEWPHYFTPLQRRANMKAAIELLESAGYHLVNNRLIGKDGKQLSVEFLLSTIRPYEEQPTALYVASLKRLGIDAQIRKVDQAQFLNRAINYDYDVVLQLVKQSNSPGNEQLEYFGSSYATMKGGRNYAGVKNPAVDKLITLLLAAKTAEEVQATTRALDRVLLWNYYAVPLGQEREINIAYWEKMSFPALQPPYLGFDFLSGWINDNTANSVQH